MTFTTLQDRSNIYIYSFEKPRIYEVRHFCFNIFRVKHLVITWQHILLIYSGFLIIMLLYMLVWFPSVGSGLFELTRGAFVFNSTVFVATNAGLIVYQCIAICFVTQYESPTRFNHISFIWMLMKQIMMK